MLRETTSRGRCELVCPSRTNERGGEGDCVKGGGEKKGSVRGSVQGRCDYTTALDIQVERRGFSRHESDFALQAHVECRAFEPERIVRSVLLRWQSSGNEVCRGPAVGL